MRADDMLDKYKEAISATPYDIESMGENIPNLYTLNRIYNLYQQPDPWYTTLFTKFKHKAGGGPKLTLMT